MAWGGNDAIKLWRIADVSPYFLWGNQVWQRPHKVLHTLKHHMATGFPTTAKDLLYDIQTTVPGQWHCSLPVSATSLKHVSLWLSSLWCFVSIIPKLTQLSWTIDGERDYNPTAVKFLSDPARNFHCLQKIQAQNPQFLPEVNKSVCLTLPLSFRITS